MQREIPLADAREMLASKMKRSLLLTRGSSRLRVEPDASVSSLYSAKVGRLVFGRESLEVLKVQAGVRIPFKPKELKVRVSPASAEFRSQEAVQVSHSLKVFEGGSQGYSRSVRVSNFSDSSLRMRLISLHDPTTLNFRRDRDPPGEIGVNAFNRGDQVVMDDVGDSSGVRILAFSPVPATVYMTRDRQRALDLLASGELPDATAGMSGAILVLSQHDFELRPGGSAELTLRAVYNQGSLESALADLGVYAGTPGTGDSPVATEPSLRTSNPSVNFAFAWASSAMRSIEAESDPFERLCSAFGLRMLRPSYYEGEFERARATQRRDGLLPHASSGGVGPMETSVFLIHACAHLLLRSDRKVSKKWYPTLRKAGLALRLLASKGLIGTSASAPEGWRRRLGSGYPTGQLSELNLVASRALTDLSVLSYWLGKGGDSATFKEASIKLGEGVLSSMKDVESGSLALNVDPKGRLHKEATVDQAVGLSFASLDHDLASSMVHRLLEKDFETGFGPRTIPSSNPLYYSSSYGDGQLGGFWTRASLAHALLAYQSGYPIIAGQGLERVARLVHSECEAMGGMPGEFPYWFDPEKRMVGSFGSDPVAASNFIEAIVTGELGLSVTPRGAEVRPPPESRLRWLELQGLELGSTGALFMGRTASGVFIASTYEKLQTEASRKFLGFERLDSSPAIDCLLFWDRLSILVCVGNLGYGDHGGRITIPVKGKPISHSLFADLEELDPVSGSWKRLERRKLLDKLDLDVEVRSGAWKVFRVSQITS